MADGTETEETIKADYKVLLSENYAIDTDKLNLILKERYEKKDGKGKFANTIEGLYGWRPLGYFGSLTHVADYIVKHELMKEYEIGELRDVAERIEAVRDDILDTILDRVEVVKG